ncbi:MAG: hypothetical protein Q7T71_01770 [Herbiconiux sp.]|nr:hypothetical protein [Herbiconiux sp.]
MSDSPNAARWGMPFSITTAIVEGRRALLLFRLGGGRVVPVRRLTPEERLAVVVKTPTTVVGLVTGAAARTWQGALIAVIPLIVLAAASGVAPSLWAPGWITWLWCAALCCINLIYLVGGPLLWNGLLTAGIAIDRADMTDDDVRWVARWVRGHYHSLSLQAIAMLAGAAVGVGLLAFIDYASGYRFTLGPGEFTTMAFTAGLSVNGLWILWWIAELIPTLGGRPSLRLDWHNPARTPAIVYLNRALWKAGGAISLGMVFLALAVLGQPSPFTSWGGAPGQWAAAIIVECIAFLIVACVFVRDGIWAQWQVFRLVRAEIERGRLPIDRNLWVLREQYLTRGDKDADVLYYAQLDRHFDSLRAVDLDLGWALAWGTSIFGAAVSLLATAFTITPG